MHVVHRPLRARALGLSTSLLAVAALAACGSSAGGGATSGSAGEGSSSSPASSSASGSASPTSSASTPGGSDAGGAGGTTSPAGGASLPKVQLQRAEESHAKVQVDWKGEEPGPLTFPEQTLTDTATAAFSATKVSCEGELSTGHPVPCAITSTGEGGFDGEVFTAYAVWGGGANKYGVLFVQGKNPLPQDLADFVQDEKSMVYGIEKGVEYAGEDHDAKSLAEDVSRLTTDSHAKMAWADDEATVSVDSSTCSDGLTASSFTPADCHLEVGGGLPFEVKALPALWTGEGAESGLLVIANGSD